jgi:hypothetical protein
MNSEKMGDNGCLCG